MQVSRRHDRVSLRLNILEAHILFQVLRSIVKHYKMKPAELEPHAARAWYSTSGCERAKMSAEETSDWLEALHGFKSAQLRRLEEWVARLATRTAPQIDLEFTFNEATSLITILNDYRLLVASQNDIGQRQMDMHSGHELKQLSEAQQNALCEIDFLAWLMEELLRHTAPEASRWMES